MSVTGTSHPSAFTEQGSTGTTTVPSATTTATSTMAAASQSASIGKLPSNSNNFYHLIGPVYL